MRFTDKSFAVGQRGRSPSVCATNGHAEPDYRGKCFMCGERLQSPSQQMLDRAAREGLTIKECTVTIKLTPQMLERLGLRSPDKVADSD